MIHNLTNSTVGSNEAVISTGLDTWRECLSNTPCPELGSEADRPSAVLYAMSQRRRTTMKRVHLLLWLFLGIAGAADSRLVAQLQTTADPTLLPLANRQTPLWDTYTSLGILGAPRNTRYLDPNTFVPVTKITSADMTGTVVGDDD